MTKRYKRIERSQPIEETFDSGLPGAVNEKHVSIMLDDIKSLKGCVGANKKNIDGLKKNLDQNTQDINNLKRDISNLKDDNQKVKELTNEIKTTQEVHQNSIQVLIDRANKVENRLNDFASRRAVDEQATAILQLEEKINQVKVSLNKIDPIKNTALEHDKNIENLRTENKKLVSDIEMLKSKVNRMENQINGFIKYDVSEVGSSKIGIFDKRRGVNIFNGWLFYFVIIVFNLISLWIVSAGLTGETNIENSTNILMLLVMTVSNSVFILKRANLYYSIEAKGKIWGYLIEVGITVYNIMALWFFGLNPGNGLNAEKIAFMVLLTVSYVIIMIACWCDIKNQNEAKNEIEKTSFGEGRVVLPTVVLSSVRYIYCILITGMLIAIIWVFLIAI